MRTAVFIVIICISLACRAEKISDMGAALDFCRERPLDYIEGIWEFPEDNTVVLIKNTDRKRRIYDLIIVSSPDCRLNAGDKIGEMKGTIDSKKFHLSLFTRLRNGIFSDPENCAATFSDSEGAIRVEKKKVKFSLRLSRFLPKFWRVLSLFSIDNPTEKLPKGLIRLYPSSDGNGLERSKPIYL